MGENKGHGVKGPRHDNDMDDLNVSSGNLQSGRQGGQQSGQQQGSQQSGQQQGSQQSGQRQQGSQQSGQQQQGSQQSGGQHASGGTPALDDLGSRQGESAKDASQAWSQDNSSDKQGGKR
ncbi:hypothetical protein [Massilia sp. LjRoot122]|uniref:hypothetical protein n=1 Tax=Massilia sp. LjRoot122 TaxID=3342257 RepID=UPI003ECEDF4B